MRVALNLVFLVPGETGGMETYARELVPRLAAQPGLEVVALVNEETGGPRFEGVPARVVPVHAANRVEWVRGEQQWVPVLARRLRCDVVHSLASTGPVWGPGRRVTTVHDLNYLKVPDAHFGLRALGMRALVPAAARTSHRVIAISESTRDDLVAELGLPAGRIDVVPQGVTPPGAVAATPASELRARLALVDRPVLLSVSAKRPHKNLARLLGALARIDEPLRPVVVLPGYPTPHEAELRERAAALGVADDVRWLDWVGAADLEGLYALAEAFAFPSLYEGFGLPVLEAMARGVPVVCSDRSSLPEVAGDAALLVDPEDEAALAAALVRVLTDGALADRLRAAGRVQAARFSWDRTATGTVAAYRRALAGPARPGSRLRPR